MLPLVVLATQRRRDYMFGFLCAVCVVIGLFVMNIDLTNLTRARVSPPCLHRYYHQRISSAYCSNGPSGQSLSSFAASPSATFAARHEAAGRYVCSRRVPPPSNRQGRKVPGWLLYRMGKVKTYSANPKSVQHWMVK
jgi:hypothetical protein